MPLDPHTHEWKENPYDPTVECTLGDRSVPFRIRAVVGPLDALEAGIDLTVLQDAIASIMALGPMAEQAAADGSNPTIDASALVAARADLDKVARLLVAHPRLVDEEGLEEPPFTLWIRRLTVSDRLELFARLIPKEAVEAAVTFPDAPAAGEAARVPTRPTVQAVRRPTKRSAAA